MDTCNYDNSINICLYLFWTVEWIIDVITEQPDLLGKHRLGRELKIKGIVTLFHWKNIHSLPLINLPNQTPTNIVFKNDWC